MATPIDMRLVIKEQELAARLRRYVDVKYGGDRGAMTLVVRQALRQFLASEMDSVEFQEPDHERTDNASVVAGEASRH